MADRIVAVGLLTQQDLNLLGPTFERAWPLENLPASFEDLLTIIDDGDCRLQAKLQPMARNEPT